MRERAEREGRELPSTQCGSGTKPRKAMLPKGARVLGGAVSWGFNKGERNRSRDKFPKRPLGTYSANTIKTQGLGQSI